MRMRLLMARGVGQKQRQRTTQQRAQKKKNKTEKKHKLNSLTKLVKRSGKAKGRSDRKVSLPAFGFDLFGCFCLFLSPPFLSLCLAWCVGAYVI